MTSADAVVSIDLSDLGPDREPDPLGEVVLALACSAARLVQQPREHIGAVTALTALQLRLEQGMAGSFDALPEAAEFVAQALNLITVAAELASQEV